MDPTRHHLDHASTTPVRPAAIEAVTDALHRDYADPSRLHHDALVARATLEDARDRVAAGLGARNREVVFTSGATESVAMVCAGVSGRGPAQVVTAVEHRCVRDGAASAGTPIVVAVDGAGRVDPASVAAALDARAGDVAVVHVQLGNHEVGTIEPVAEVATLARERDVLVHVDAAQAVGRVPVDFGGLEVDLLSVSGHKVGGPPGTGALLVRRGVRLDPLLHGGDQERARRAGMENIAGALGLAAALESIDVTAEAAQQRRLGDRLRAGLAALEGVAVIDVGEPRLPHLVCATLDDIEPQAVLLGLDRQGISAHSGSVCASEEIEPSPVLAAMGLDAARSLRFSFGWTSTDDDVDAVLDALPRVLDDLRSLRT